MKVTYLGIRSAHERVWLVERKPRWQPRAYLTRGDLEPARGNLHVCKFLRDLTNIQIRTVTAERAIVFRVHLPDERVTTQQRKQVSKGRKEGRKEGKNQKEKAREKEQLTRKREKALDSIRPETNNSVLSWINTRISFLLPFTPAIDNMRFQWWWGFGGMPSTPLLPSLPGLLWPGMVVPDWTLSMG